MPTPLKFLLPLCLIVACLASAPPLPASPGGAPRQEDALREWVETRLQHLERRLLLQEEAALATAKQERRLLELETEIERLRKEWKAWINDAQNPIIATAEKKKEEVRETGDRYVSMAGSGFTALGVLMAIIALVPIFFAIANTVSFNESAKQKLREIDRLKYDAQKIGKQRLQEILEKMETEANIYIEKIKKAQQEVEGIKNNLKKSLSLSMEKEIPKSTIDDANELIRQGKGVDVLWGYATLAMQKKAWREACQYWEAVLRQSPNDDIARFNLAKCRIFLLEKSNVTPQERQNIFNKDDPYYAGMLKEQPNIFRQNKAIVLMFYARLKRLQARYTTEFQSRNSLRENAERLLWEAKSLAPQNTAILRLLARIKRDQANDPQTAPEMRATLRKDAEELLQDARRLSPQNVSIFRLLARIKRDQANDSQTAPETRATLRKDAEELLQDAHRLAPKNVSIFRLLARIKRDQAHDSQTTPAMRATLREDAEQLLEEAKAIAPQDAITLIQLSSLRIEQARDATQEDRTRFLDEAEAFLDELAPQDAPKEFYNRACIAALRGQPEKALDFLEQSRKAGTLPSREHIEKDKDMDSLRQREDFKKFLQRAYSESKGEK